MPRNALVVATFRDGDRLTHAVRVLRREGFRIYDVYAPFPVHDLGEAMGIRRSRLPWVTLLAGGAGLLSALFLQFYAAVFDWPMNVGGKPDNSTLAFIPITFELTVLIGGLATVAALFVRARLYPGKRASVPADAVTDDAFAVVLRKRDDSFDVGRACLVLRQNGAERIDERDTEL